MTTRATIDTDLLRRWLSAGDPVTVLDVRTNAQRSEWHIPGTVHVDAYERLKAGEVGALDDVDIPKTRPVVVVCEAGRTSVTAARHLRARGYEAMSLAGGMRSWSLAWNTAGMDVADDLHFVQVRRTGKGCLSYVLISRGEALVIDPALPPEIFMEIAAEHHANIVGVLETHVHADHLSRGKALADALGVPWYLPEQDRIACTFSPLRHGDRVDFGRAGLGVIHTPGHTWESSSYLVAGSLFTGDTLFTDGVGRPDLEAGPEEASQRAAVLFETLRALSRLSDDTIVLPGHTSEPIAFDGVAHAARLAGVVADVPLLGLDRQAFIEQLTGNVPEAPPNHARIVQLNESCALPTDPVELEAGANRCAVR